MRPLSLVQPLKVYYASQLKFSDSIIPSTKIRLQERYEICSNAPVSNQKSNSSIWLLRTYITFDCISDWIFCTYEGYESYWRVPHAPKDLRCASQKWNIQIEPHTVPCGMPRRLRLNLVCIITRGTDKNHSNSKESVEYCKIWTFYERILDPTQFCMGCVWHQRKPLELTPWNRNKYIAQTNQSSAW